jgi:hypothetical protein
MSNVYEIIAKLRASTGDADNLAWLSDQEDRVKELLQAKEYYLLPETQKLLSVFRTAIVAARKILGTDRHLSQQQRDTLWSLIEARKSVVEYLARDFDTELEEIESELASELTA